jgi:hypothetical protein
MIHLFDRLSAAGRCLCDPHKEEATLHWWDEAEARARRAKSPVGLAQSLAQRLQAAGIDPDLGFAPAYDLACLHDLCADLVKIVDGMLETADGDAPQLRRYGLVLLRWARSAQAWTVATAPGFNQLIDGLDLEPEKLKEREEASAISGAEAGRPEEQPKVDGRYQHWHLLYERLDLKLTAAGVAAEVSRALARSLARIYEQALVLIRQVSGLEKESRPRFGAVARLLLDVNTVWHFDLGPYHLGYGELRARGQTPYGLQTDLLLAFGRTP